MPEKQYYVPNMPEDDEFLPNVDQAILEFGQLPGFTGQI